MLFEENKYQFYVAEFDDFSIPLQDTLGTHY